MATSNVQRLEQNRSNHITQMNRLESELRSQEVTITTLGNFINNLAYDRTDIELPTDILRILSQINSIQRRKSEGLPKPKATTPKKLKSTVSSPDFGDRVSRIFRRNNLQIFSEAADNESDDESLFTKSVSDSKNILKPNVKSASSPSSLNRNESLGRMLTPEDIQSLRDIAQKQTVKDERVSDVQVNIEVSPAEGTSIKSVNDTVAIEGKNLETEVKESSPSSSSEGEKKPASNKMRKISTGYLTRKSTSNPAISKSDLKLTTETFSFHPLGGLSSGGVTVSYEGTTKLKSFDPFRTKGKDELILPADGSKKNSDEVNVINKGGSSFSAVNQDLLFNRSNLLTR